jgi:hypothetical protein
MISTQSFQDISSGYSSPGHSSLLTYHKLVGLYVAEAKAACYDDAIAQLEKRLINEHGANAVVLNAKVTPTIESVTYGVTYHLLIYGDLYILEAKN